MEFDEGAHLKLIGRMLFNHKVGKKGCKLPARNRFEIFVERVRIVPRGDF